MTEQEDCSKSEKAPEPHNAFLRLIDSYEYAVPAEQCTAFADHVLNIADQIRATNDAIIVILNLRFTKRTRASIGMQQFAKTGHVEIYLIRGMAGNERFERELYALAAESEYTAIPHWGQLHDKEQEFESLFRSSTGSGRNPLREWRGALDRMAREGEGGLNTFRHDFALQRQLLFDL